MVKFVYSVCTNECMYVCAYFVETIFNTTNFIKLIILFFRGILKGNNHIEFSENSIKVGIHVHSKIHIQQHHRRSDISNYSLWREIL